MIEEKSKDSVVLNINYKGQFTCSTKKSHKFNLYFASEKVISSGNYKEDYDIDLTTNTGIHILEINMKNLCWYRTIKILSYRVSNSREI